MVLVLLFLHSITRNSLSTGTVYNFFMTFEKKNYPGKYTEAE